MSTPIIEEEIGGVPLLWGYPTLPGEFAVHCRFCLAWHHHRLMAIPTVIDYYRPPCYAWPDWQERGYWVRIADEPWVQARKRAQRASPAQAVMLASGRTSEDIRRKQRHPGPEPRPRRPEPAPWKPKTRAPSLWPTSYPTFPDDDDD